LPYPGGPMIDKYAKEGNPLAYKFPDVKAPKLGFSFSGIKTSFLYFLKKELKKNPKFIAENKADICASIQHTLIRLLMKKLIKATEIYGISQVGIAGGVSANSGLRETLTATGKELGWDIFIPDFEYCTDNAGMIAMAAHFKYLAKDFSSQDISPMPRMKI